MNYQKTRAFLYNKLPYYQRDGLAAYKTDLTNSLFLDNYFNSPHKKYKTIHIAGTNGKGSVSNIIANVLQNAGYKTGLYTSPHLKDFRERILINGKKISKSYVCNFIDKNKKIISELNPSFFEITVAMAFNYFAMKNVDFAVIEVGLGGRLDSTNIIHPILSVITNISYDHTHILGKTLQEIAKEKAGIIKHNIPVIIGESNDETDEIFKDIAKEKHSMIEFTDKLYLVNANAEKNNYVEFNISNKSNILIKNLKTKLTGKYQEKNIITSIAAISTLKEQNIDINEKSIRKGFKNLKIQGRFQVIQKKPEIICDNGHNIEGIKNVLNQIYNKKYNQLHIVIGFVNDKEIDEILKILPKEAIYYFTQANQPRSLNSEELKTMANKHGLNGQSFTSVKKALKQAKKEAKKNDLIYVGGSTFVVAEVI